LTSVAMLFSFYFPVW